MKNIRLKNIFAMIAAIIGFGCAFFFKSVQEKDALCTSVTLILKETV